MKTSTLKRRGKSGRRLKRASKEISVERVVDRFHSALLCIDQFGFSGGLIMGSFMLTSFLVQTARAFLEKAVF